MDALRIRPHCIRPGLRTLPVAVLILAALADAGFGARAVAVDVPLTRGRIRITRSAAGVERLSFVSWDPAVSFPAPGTNPGDPTIAGTGNGAVVEVFGANDSGAAVFIVPSGTGAAPRDPGWRNFSIAGGLRYKYDNRDAPAAPSAVRRFVIKDGRRLEVRVERSGLRLLGPEGVVGIRITDAAGNRMCAQFDPANAGAGARDVVAGSASPVYAVGRAAPVPPADCSDAALNTASFLRPDLFASLDAQCDDDVFVAPSSTPPSCAGFTGRELHRVGLTDPLAVCNDGSPAVMFVRPAPLETSPGVPNPRRNEWIIWLEGGGACRDPAECGDRWCDLQAGPYNARKMSSVWEDWAIGKTGIFGGNASNHFTDYNMVMVKYCSSDLWVGRRTVDQPESDSPAPPDGSGSHYPRHRVAFHGAHIVEAAIRALREPGGVAADDACVTMPSLADATEVLFTGTSAGAFGATLNVNSAADLIVDGAAGAAPRVRLVSDAATGPYEADVAGGVDQIEVDGARAVMNAGWAMSGGLPDAACTDAHAGDPEGICRWPSHILAHHMTVSAFVQMDIEDNTIGPWLYDTFALFGLGTRPLLEGIADGSLVYGGTEPTSQAAVGMFAPRCCHHVTLENSDFFDILVADPGSPGLGGRRNLNDTLHDWVIDASVPVLVDQGGAFDSGCPGTGVPLVAAPCPP